MAQSAAAVEYADCFSAEGKEYSVMKLNNLSVTLQKYWSFG